VQVATYAKVGRGAIGRKRQKENRPYAIREQHMPDPLIKSKNDGLS